MSKLNWDDVSKHTYEQGVSKGVLYPQAAGATYPNGVAWNGLTAVNEKPSGAEPTKQYADNRVYAVLMSAEEYDATIEAFTYPDEFAECDGSKEIAPGVFAGQQTRKPFGLSYRTEIGNGGAGDDVGYKLHLVYGAKASPSEKSHNTLNDSPELATLSWELATTPIAIPGFKPTAHITVDSTKTTNDKMAALEAILYGTDSTGEGEELVEATEARLPSPAELATLFAESQDT